MLLTIGAAILVLGVLIFVHELGHFLAAKWVGIGVPRFSLGFGPFTPIRFRRGETEYVISWIPFGGYVKMATAEEDEHAAMEPLEGGEAAESFPPHKLFENKPLAARILVISAGVIMNILFAWVAYSVLAGVYGRAEVPTTAIAAVDTTSLPGAAGSFAGLPFGAKIVRINSDSVATWNAVQDAILDPRGDRLRFDFAGGIDPIILPIPGTDATARFAILNSLQPLLEARIGFVAPGKPADRAGLRAGDLIVHANADTVRHWAEFVKAIERRAGETVTLGVVRDSALVSISVVPAAEELQDPRTGQRHPVGRIGVRGFETRQTRFGPVGSIVEGGRVTLESASTVWFAVKSLVMGRLSPKELGGPIMIGQLSGQFARGGPLEFIRFIAFFSVNLAILNLLPVPVLDGGHLVFLFVEGLRGKPLSVRLRLRLTQVGMALLMCLMLLALTNDIVRLVH